MSRDGAATGQATSIVEIAGVSNLILRALQYEKPLEKLKAGENPKVTACVDFEVDRQTTANISSHFRTLTLGQNFRERNQALIEYREITPAVLELILRIFHNPEDGYRTHLDLPFNLIWELLRTIDRMLIPFDREQAKQETAFHKWFANWYATNKDEIPEFDDPRNLFYPCYRFDHAAGFGEATKEAAYEKQGHIDEAWMAGYEDMHCPHRVIRRYAFTFVARILLIRYS